MENIKTKPIINCIVGIVFVFIAVSMVLINLRQFNIEMDPDLAAEAILGRQIWEYGSINPKTWIPSTETRILSPVQLSGLIYGITGDMNLSMGLSCAILLIVVMMLLLWLLRSLNFEWCDVFLVGIMLMIIPGSLRHQQIIFLFADYYTVHIIAILLTLITYSLVFKGNRLGSCITGVVTIFVSAGLALQGMRLGMVLTCPLMATLVVRDIWFWLTNGYFSWKDRKYRITFIGGVILTVISVLGLFTPYAIPVETSRNIRHAYSKFIEEVVPDFQEMLNFNCDSHSFKALCVVVFAIVILTLVGIVILYIRKLVVCRKLKNTADFSTTAFTYLFFLMSLLVSLAMCVFTTNDVAWRYFFMYYFVAAFTIGILSHNAEKVIAHNPLILISLFTVCFAIVGWRSNLHCAVEPKHVDEEIEQIVSIMRENDCYYGYSTFGSAGTLSVRANGRIQVAAIDNFEKMNISKWLTDRNWYCPNLPYEMNTAYVIPKERAEDFSKAMEVYNDMKLVGETGNYLIYVTPFNYSNLGD